MEYYISTRKFLIIAIVMLIIWFSMLTFFYIKADEVTKHPCEICADKVGENIICNTGGLNPTFITFNNSIP